MTEEQKQTIESISTDILDEEQEQESHNLGRQTSEIIDNEFETLKELGFLQKEFSSKSEDLITKIENNKEVPDEFLARLKKILLTFQKQFETNKNNESRLSMTRYILDNFGQINIKLNNYSGGITNNEIEDLIKRQEIHFSKSAIKENLTNPEDDTKLPILWIIGGAIFVAIVIFLISTIF